MDKDAGAVRLDRSNTAILVDSTADLPPYLAEDPNVSMIPLLVRFGEETFRDWVDIKPEQFFAKLRVAPQLPTTSQPSVGAFIQEYQRLRASYDHVYSIHLSALMSGTIASATLAAEEVDGVTVIDSLDVCHSLSLLVDRLLVRLDRGTTHEEFMAYVEYYKAHRGMLFLLATLDYIYKGGRIGRASHLMGGLLNVKPLLTYVDGNVEPYKKVRGDRKALEAMRDYLVERTVPGRPVYLAIGQAEWAERLETLVGMIKETDRQIDLRFRGQVGSVIGTYSGPGAIVMFFIQE
jgi:DegV family protein with EDD domain